MTRVSENSATNALQNSIKKAKAKMEDLQLKGSTLKRIRKPSDDPVANVEALSLGSVQKDNEQYLRNSSYALMQLNTTEEALEQITNILVKAKELAIQQSSDFYDKNVRSNVSNEVIQLRNQALAIANRRVGQRFIFAGHSTLSRPFDIDGEYLGSNGKINLEVSKDFFVPINLTGKEVFYGADLNINKSSHPLKDIPELKLGKEKQSRMIERDLASEDSIEEQAYTTKDNIFAQLSNFVSALENNEPQVVQDLLERLDRSITNLITLRTRVGSIINSIENAQEGVEVNKLNTAERKSKLVDADIVDLFSEISRQKDILETTYKSGSNMLNKKLLDFLR
ncbi:MAG: flagellar hook-associated protein FlgL [Halobacteriovoraceae bacterium]|nr:flagellar hook-associated protein FlgL [Halobacteriovoraceae bacterium]